MGFEQIKVTLLDHWPKRDRDPIDGDRAIANSAWVSTYDLEKVYQKSPDEVFRVVNQIIDHSHTTPLETVWMNFFITTPIFVERQADKVRQSVQMQDFRIEWQEGAFGRHGITQNELSLRYRTAPDRHFSLPEDVGSIMSEVAPDKAQDIVAKYEDILTEQHSTYKGWLDLFPAEWKKPGHPRNQDYRRCREVLRGILGTSFLTDMRLILNLNAFEHMMNQRLPGTAQPESRVTAYWMLREVQDHGVAPEAVGRMFRKNLWDEHCYQIETIYLPVSDSK